LPSRSDSVSALGPRLPGTSPIVPSRCFSWGFPLQERRPALRPLSDGWILPLTFCQSSTDLFSLMNTTALPFQGSSRTHSFSSLQTTSNSFLPLRTEVFPGFPKLFGFPPVVLAFSSKGFLVFPHPAYSLPLSGDLPSYF